MDAMLEKLVASGSCAVDGTVAANSRNPLNRLVDSAMQSVVPASMIGAHPPQNYHPQALPPAAAPEVQGMEAQVRAAQQQSREYHYQQQHMEHMAMMERTYDQQWAAEYTQSQSQQRMEHAFQARAIHHQDIKQAAGKLQQPAPIMHPHPRQQQQHYPHRNMTPYRPQYNPGVIGMQPPSRNIEAAWQVHQQNHPQTSRADAISDSRRVTESVASAMSANPDPRWQNSEFLNLMKEVSSGNAEFTEKEIVHTSDGTPVVDSKPPAAEVINDDLEGAWKTSSSAEPNHTVLQEQELEKIWQKALDEATAATAASSEDTFEDIFNNDSAFHMSSSDLSSSSSIRPYDHAADNSYLESPSAFEEGVRLFNDGHVNEAILAFEAAVQQVEEHSEAWRMLGECHAENDEDKKAIACLERAVEHDAYDLSALLALGTSYVNELDSSRALNTLKAWVKNNPKFNGLEIRLDDYSDGSLMDEVMQLMAQAEAFDPSDADVKVVLGVLYNVSKDFNAAAKSFRESLGASREGDYTLWNKLGATLANDNRSSEAIPAYHRALELKPKYARGWLNLGVSHANSGEYQEASRCYLQALSLNPQAVHIWSYLRIAFTCLDRFDLVKQADTRDINVFKSEFQLIDL